MKIEGPRKSSGTKGASKSGAAKASGDASFSGLIDDAEETQARKSVSGTMSVSQIDALLSLQEAGDGTPEEATRKARLRANTLLDHLDRLRLGLLAGEVPVATLHQLKQVMAQHRDRVLDPRLLEVLDEIDLRVQVELAKLEAL